MLDIEREELKTVAWEEEKEAIRKMGEIGVEAYLKSLPEFRRAFNFHDKYLRCIDEGTPGGIHLAGSGILMELDEAKKVLQAADAEGIYTHDECGAAKLYAKAEGLDLEYADDYCREWVKSLCEKTGLPYKGHISINEMKRPSGSHIASVIYYDATGKFDNTTPGMPSGFVISRKYLETDYAKKELEVALDIALGGHGFGHLFTTELPLHVIIFSDNSADLSIGKLAKEIEPVTSKHGSRIVIDSITI